MNSKWRFHRRAMQHRVPHILVCITLALLVPAARLAYAQTQTREKVIAEIEDYAQRHVENGSDMKTEVVLDLYRDNTVGLTPREIATIYEEAYARFKEEAKPSLWEQFRPNAGWVAAALLEQFIKEHNLAPSPAGGASTRAPAPHATERPPGAHGGAPPAR